MYPQVAEHIEVNRELNSMRLLLRVRDRNSRPLFPQLGSRGGNYTHMGQTRHGKRLEQLIRRDLWVIFSVVWFLCFWESLTLPNSQDMQTHQYLWMDEWIKVHTHIYTQWILFILPFATTGMDLEVFTLSEISQSHKDKSVLPDLTYYICGI